MMRDVIKGAAIGIAGLLGALAILLAEQLLTGLVIYDVWSLLVVPHGFPPISARVAIGMNLIFSVLSYRSTPVKKITWQVTFDNLKRQCVFLLIVVLFADLFS